MGGEGSISAMITSLKNNKALLGTRKGIFDRRDLYPGRKAKRKLVFNNIMTQEELALFSLRLRTKKRILDITATVVIVLVLAAAVYITLITLN